MTQEQLNQLLTDADLIVSGYAFKTLPDRNIRIVHLLEPYHVVLIDSEGNVLETNMHEIELDIVLNKYWAKNKIFLTA